MKRYQNEETTCRFSMEFEKESLYAGMNLGQHSMTSSMTSCRNAPIVKTWKRLFLAFADVVKLPIEVLIPASLLIDNEDLSKIYLFTEAIKIFLEIRVTFLSIPSIYMCNQSIKL